MIWLKMSGTALAVAAVGLAVACDGGAATPPSEISEEDLALMVLQQEDVPAEFRKLPDSPNDRGFHENGLSASQATYIVDFELPPDEAEPGETVCMRNSALLYKTHKDAIEAFREGEELQRELEEEGVEFGGEEVALPDLGDQSLLGFRFSSPDTDFCSYEDEPTEGHMIIFRHRNVVGGLIVFTYERGASLDEAIELAQKQASRIEAVFERDDAP